MVFEGKTSENMFNPNITVNEIEEDGIDLFDSLMVKGFAMPAEWKEVFDRFVIDSMRKGARNYLAYARRTTCWNNQFIFQKQNRMHSQCFNTQGIQETWDRNRVNDARYFRLIKRRE